MSHYTLQSGIRSATYTSRCPICRTVQYYTEQDKPPFLTDDDISCCTAHSEQYKINLWKLWYRAQNWGAKNGMYNTHHSEILNRYITEVGH